VGTDQAWAKSISLREALADCSAKAQLSITLADTQQIQGMYVGMGPDSLTIHLGEGDAHLHHIPLEKIVRVRRWHSDSAQASFRLGAAAGILLGGLGLMVGLAASQYESNDTPGVVFLTTGLGIGLGFATGGIIGAGVGALFHSWYDVWPLEIRSQSPPPDPHSRNSRLNIVAGIGHSSLANYEVTRFAGRVALLKRAGAHYRLGPEISHVDFGGTRTTYGQDGSIEEQSVSSISRIALTVEASSSQQGVLPYFNLGLGGSVADEIVFSGHLGGGMRSRRASGIEFDLDVRFNFNFSATTVGEVGSYWTFGLGFGFGL